MINPAGDAKHPGRIIDDAFERGITFQCAQQIKKHCELNSSNVTIILARTPGQHLEPFQAAQFANRLSVDLYISLHFFHAPAEKKMITIYHYLQQPTDYWLRQSAEPTFVPYDQAHIPSLTMTSQIAQKMKQLCEIEFTNKGYQCIGPFATRLKPLAGITSPAILLEIGLEKKDDWQQVMTPLVTILQKMASYIP